MRLPVSALALLCVSVAACSSDVKSPTQVSPVKPLAVTRVDLAFTGSVPLYTSRANAINDSGVVVGSAAVNPSDVSRAVVWRPSGYAFEFLPDENVPGGSSANAVGRDGVIGGQIGCGTTGAVSCTPVYWRNGVLHKLDGVGQVNGVCPCDSHTLVGQVLVNGALHGALWIDDVLIDVGVPAPYANAQLKAVAHGFIVGNTFGEAVPDPSTAVAFRWAPSSGWTRLEGVSDAGTFAADVNSSGTAVGAAGGAARWLNGANTPTPIPDQVSEGFFSNSANVINDSGVVAGTFRGGGHPFPSAGIWTAADGWTLIAGDMNPIVTDINNSNQVVGYGHDQGEDFAAIWQP